MNRSSLLKSSAILSATTLVTTSGHAEVIYSGVLNLTANSSTPAFFDLDGDAENDYKFFFHDNNQNKPIIASADYEAGTGTNLTFAVNSERGLTVTPAGTMIDSSFLGGTSQAYPETFFYQNVDGPTVVGEWENGGAPVSGYVGFAVPRGGDDYNFGWAHMVVDIQNTTLTLVDFAYETDLNTGIMTAVPEVSTTSAAVVGALALLLAHRRKQRNS